MMNCKEATRLLSDAQERELSLKEKSTLKIHVMMCSGCSNFARQMNILRDFSHAYTKGGEDGGDDGNVRPGSGTLPDDKSG